MQNLEQIIRPFQSPNTLPTRRLVSNSTKIPEQSAAVAWGSAGTLPAPEKREDNTSGLNFEVVKCDDHYSETNRAYNVVRIENPDDASQYVMVERINKISFNKKSETELQMYNNSTTSFVPLPAFDNTTYYKSNYGQNKCQSHYTLSYPTR